MLRGVHTVDARDRDDRLHRPRGPDDRALYRNVESTRRLSRIDDDPTRRGIDDAVGVTTHRCPRAIRAADQRRAEKLGLNASDFPADFTQEGARGEDCLNPKHEGKLTITGENGSPEFSKYRLDDPPSPVDALA